MQLSDLDLTYTEFQAPTEASSDLLNRTSSDSCRHERMRVCCSESDCTGENCIQLTERELMVCGIICGSSLPLGFSDIRRHSGLHQTVVTRIIHTLESHRVVEKVGGKYRKAM